MGHVLEVIRTCSKGTEVDRPEHYDKLHPATKHLIWNFTVESPLNCNCSDINLDSR